MFRRFARKTLRYFTDWSRLGVGYRRQDCQCGETADSADFEQIRGVLSHAGLPVCLYHKVHKEGTKDTKGKLAD